MCHHHNQKCRWQHTTVRLVSLSTFSPSPFHVNQVFLMTFFIYILFIFIICSWSCIQCIIHLTIYTGWFVFLVPRFISLVISIYTNQDINMRFFVTCSGHRVIFLSFFSLLQDNIPRRYKRY